MNKNLIKVLVLLLVFIMGCSRYSNCECNCRQYKGRTLLGEETIKEVRTLDGFSGHYIDFENNRFALLPVVLGDRMKAGQTGCLYVFDKMSQDGNFIYFWHVKK